MEKIVLAKVAWMNDYQGYKKSDPQHSFAKHYKTHDEGGESNNFKNRGGKVYGYTPLMSAEISKLGASNEDKTVQGVTVVFCAPHPEEKRTCVVGWYKNATVYRSAKRIYNDGFLFKADFKNSTLLAANKRFLFLDKVFGRSPLRYIGKDKNLAKILTRLNDYIASGGNKLTDSKGNSLLKKGKKLNHKAWQQDIELRKKVELAAMDSVADYYTDLGWDVEYVHKQNKGWDMEARKNKLLYLLEVKGLSGIDINIELTPNEYLNSKRNKSNYKICIITNALSKKRQLSIFSFKKYKWESIEEVILESKERTSLVLSARPNQ